MGNSISSKYIKDLQDMLEGKGFFHQYYQSKSGTTTEPAIAFRVFKKMLIEKYGKRGKQENLCDDG